MPRTNPQLTVTSTFQGTSIPLGELIDLLNTARRSVDRDTATVSVRTLSPDRPGEMTTSTITICGAPATRPGGTLRDARDREEGR